MKSFGLKELAEHYFATESEATDYVSASDYEKLLAENEALTAQVEALRKVVNENSIDSVIIYQAKRILRQGSAGTWLKDSNVNGGKRQGGEK